MLLEGRPSRWELGVWAALHRINPWGDQRADQRAAIGHALLANINRDSKRNPQAFKVRDFMPYSQPTQDDLELALAQQIFETFKSLGKGADRKAWKARRRLVGKR